MKPAPLPIDEVGRLEALERYAALESPPSTSFDHLTSLAAAIFDVPIALVSMVDVTTQWFKSRFGLDVSSTSRDISFCGHAIMDDDVFVVLDAANDERFADNPLVTGEPHIRSYMGAPLRTPSGHRIGTLCIIDRKPRAEFSDADRQVLTSLAELVVDEFELQLATAELRERDETLRRYYEVMGASTDFIALVAPTGEILGMNPAGRAMVGLAPDEPVVGRFMGEFHSPERVREVIEIAIPHAQEFGSWRGETDIVTVDGRLIPVDQVILVHRDAQGEISFQSTVIRDISDRNEVKRLQHLETLKNEFISTVSHELRTPLSSIITSLEMLDDGVLGELDTGVAELVRVALTNSSRLIHLVDDLLDLERLEMVSLDLEPSSVNIRELVESALMVVAATAHARDILLRAECEVAADAIVECDADRMRRVIVNLLGNAIKFSGGDTTVVVGAEVVDHDLELRVSDEGIGIDPNLIPRMFDPFWQADSSASRSAGGSGLGLAITKRIVERHGGSIQVESALGEGATFRVRIPLTFAGQ